MNVFTQGFLAAIGTAAVILGVGWLLDKWIPDRLEARRKRFDHQSPLEPQWTAVCEHLEHMRNSLIAIHTSLQHIKDKNFAYSEAVIAALGQICNRMDHFNSPVADLQHLLTVACENVLQTTKAVETLVGSQTQQHNAHLAALDALAEKFDGFAKSQKAFLEAIFPSHPPKAYEEMDDEAAYLREKAGELQRRYGLSDDEARARAKNLLAYRGNSGMRGEA